MIEHHRRSHISVEDAMKAMMIAELFGAEQGPQMNAFMRAVDEGHRAIEDRDEWFFVNEAAPSDKLAIWREHGWYTGRFFAQKRRLVSDIPADIHLLQGST